MTRKCFACGILFERRPSTKGMYCDQRCKARAQIKQKRVTCAACGKELRRAASELARTRTSVCDRTCQTRAQAIPWETVSTLRDHGLSYRRIGEMLGFGRTKAERIYKQRHD